MYSASIAPQFQEYSARWRAVLAYLLTDQAYALTVYREGDVKWYYVGAAAGLWVTWQTTTVLGVVVGARVPDSWQLTFAVPLTFLALVVPAVEERPGVAAAGVAAVVSVAAVSLPYNLGLLSGAVAGVAAGAVVALRTEDDPFAVAEGEP
jgi:predicted branched-subunit amino acid permease